MVIKMKEKIEKMFNQGFIKNNNYKIIDVNEEMCKIEGIVTDTSLNPFGIAHGGYIFGLVDTTAGLLANLFGNAVTTNSSINYLNKGKGNMLIAEARILKKGKDITTCECSVYDEENKIIAKAILEYFYIRN